MSCYPLAGHFCPAYPSVAFPLSRMIRLLLAKVVNNIDMSCCVHVQQAYCSFTCIFGSTTHIRHLLRVLFAPLTATHRRSGVRRFFFAQHRVHNALPKVRGSSNDRRLAETSDVRYLESMRSVPVSHRQG